MNTQLQQSAIDIRKACDEIADMLIKKNEAYGNSALDPTRIMSKLDAVEGIKVRIDDKLNRIMQGNLTFNEDTELDLTGYFILLRVARWREKRRAEALEARRNDAATKEGNQF